MKLTYKINETDNLITVKQVLKEKFEISDRLLLRLKTNKKIYLNGNPTYVNQLVKTNDVVDVIIDFYEENDNIVPTKMKLDIIYEDEYYLVINKPAGIPVHPSMAHYETSLSNGVRYYFDSNSLHKKIRPVNRLDKNTSGIVIFAKNEYIQECLVRQMKSLDFVKQYIAICEGNFEKNKGTIDAPIARKSDSIIERCVDCSGDDAITHYNVIENFCINSSNYTKVLVTLETGRTHQIRVHMSYIGHPIVGDTLYGTASKLICRQALHSYKTSFVHPITKKQVEYIANLPEDIKSIKKEVNL